MRVMSEKIMGYIMLYVDQYFCDMQRFPSIGEIAQGVGIPRTTAYRYLVEMDRREMIEYDGKSRRVIETIRINIAERKRSHASYERGNDGRYHFIC